MRSRQLKSSASISPGRFSFWIISSDSTSHVRGEGTYPATYGVAYPDMPRNKWSAGLRIFYVIPHIVVLFFVGIAWFITAVIAWFAILFTGCTQQASTHSPSATCAGRCESSPAYCSCATNTHRSRSSRSAWSARNTPQKVGRAILDDGYQRR
jgi:Domain of unknown function (DUF4389)